MNNRQATKKMRALIRTFLLFIVGCLLLVSAAHAETQDELQSVIDQKAHALEEITKKIQETQVSLGEEAARGKTLKQEVNRIDATVKRVNLGIQVSELTIDKLGLEIEQLQQNISDKEKKVDFKRETVTQLLQDYQQRERESLLLAFLNGQSLAQNVAEQQSISDINSGLLTEVQQLRELKQDLSDQLGQASDKKKSVEVEHQTLKARKAIAEDELSQRQQLLTETKNREENYRKMISDLEKQQQQISDEIGEIEEKLRAQYGTATVPLRRHGLFGDPIEGGLMTQGYGRTPDACRLYRKTCFHNGVDFGVPIGTPALAAGDGIVLMVGNNGRVQYGKYVVIKHDNGLTTLYAHLSRQAAVIGQNVKRGDVIGYTGRTGYAFGPHLHFGVYLSSTVTFKSISGAGLVPVGFTLDPTDYL